MLLNRKLKPLLILLLSFLLTHLTFAETPEQKGLAILQESDNRDKGWRDQTASMKMTLYNRQGKSSQRKIRIKILEVKADGDKSLTIFDHPKDVKGTAFLTYSHSNKPDQQWMYLPALKRIKRIASKNKSGPFMGSEFAMEDISSFEMDKYDYKYIENQPCPDSHFECFVVEMTPRYEYSGYTRLLAWIDTQAYRIQKFEYYDRKNSLLKTQTFKNYRQYLGKYWRADEMFMQNHQTGKATQLLWQNYQFGNHLKASDFRKQVLKRIR